ncbi:GDP-mannose 4,6-dehydratase [Desulfurivibrio sp. D14AmB]|uniref:GDP-mannose 4,6-dehydratase n=1 Tax=Desulfurivibrio sp. D14AmB TaxID=3374370 RepID=UPI00376F0720
MKLLITGGCGFLGANLAAEALKRGDELIIFDNLSRYGSVENIAWLKDQGKFRHVHGDIRNANDVARVVFEIKPEAIFHLAGQVAMTTSISDPRNDFETNALGSLNVLEAVRRFAPEAAVLYSSTNKVYGDLEQYAYRETETRFECIERPDGFDETTPLDFHSPYGCSKGAADQYMRDYARIFGLRTVVFRHSSMYGGRQFATYDQGWVGWFCQKAIDASRGETKPFTISGTGKQVRDVLHAEDMVSLYFKTLDHIDLATGEAFNIGGGMANSLSLLELFGLLETIAGAKLVYKHLPPRESDQRVFVANVSKATKVLGWVPDVAATNGVNNIYEWLLAQ